MLNVSSIILNCPEKSAFVLKMASKAPASTVVSDNKLTLLTLPSELQLKIFSRLSYDDITRARLICKSINSTCQQLLTAGFHRVERFHARSLQRVKAQLPRRESERRTHELARHSDILTSIETRLSLLSMTYGKYIDGSLCCFIPGKVLDEMFRVLRIVNNTPRGDQAPRPHELLQELRDISSMAMEHFEEHIVPLLRDRISLSPSSANNAAVSTLSTSALVLYAAASGSPPFVGVPGLSTAPKHTCALRPQQFHFPGAYRRQGFRINADHSMTSETASGDNQRHRYEKLKRQFMSQRNELIAYKRELGQLRATQQRQKDKLSDMERRLNEHEQRFTDILAQLRNGGSNAGAIIGGTDEPNSATGAGVGKRKRSIHTATGNSANQSTSSTKAAPGGPAKRKKTENVVGKNQ